MDPTKIAFAASVVSILLTGLAVLEVRKLYVEVASLLFQVDMVSTKLRALQNNLSKTHDLRATRAAESDS